MYTGLVLILTASGFAIKGVKITSEEPDTTNKYLEAGWGLLCLVVISLLIFLDGVRRMFLIKVRNSEISARLVVVCSLAFLTEFCFMIPNLT